MGGRASVRVRDGSCEAELGGVGGGGGVGGVWVGGGWGGGFFF